MRGSVAGCNNPVRFGYPARFIRVVVGSIAAAVCCFAGMAQSAHKLTLSVDDPRPVSEAALELMKRHARVITYEDPLYQFSDDIKDVTLQVRKDLDRYPPGEAPPVLVPKGGRVELRYSVSDQTGEPEDWDALLRSLVQSRTRGARFRVERDGDAFHLIPEQIRNRLGHWVPNASILDVYITIPTLERTPAEIIASICSAIGEVSSTRLLDNSQIGLGVQSIGGPPRERFGVDNERARDVLFRELQRHRPGSAWRIFQGPGTTDYVLNLTRAAVRVPPASSPAAPPLPRPPPGCRPAEVCRH